MKLSARFANELVAWNEEVQKIASGKKRCSRYHRTVTEASVGFYSELYKSAIKMGL